MKDILELARECGATVEAVAECGPGITDFSFTETQLEAFVQRIREDERERCASEADGAAKRINAVMLTDGGSQVRSVILAGTVAVCQEIAAAIRRGGDHG